MMFHKRAKVFCARKFIGQAGGFMDEHRQTLWADIDFAALIFDSQQGLFLFGCTTVQANIIFHHCSQQREMKRRSESTSALIVKQLRDIVPEIYSFSLIWYGTSMMTIPSLWINASRNTAAVFMCKAL